MPSPWKHDAITTCTFPATEQANGKAETKSAQQQKPVRRLRHKTFKKRSVGNNDSLHFLKSQNRKNVYVEPYLTLICCSNKRVAILAMIYDDTVLCCRVKAFQRTLQRSISNE